MKRVPRVGYPNVGVPALLCRLIGNTLSHKSINHQKHVVQ
jgi:hypothetical protein